MSTGVLDSSAVLCALWNEPGADEVRRLVPQCVISLVKLAEVATKLSEGGLSRAEVAVKLEEISLQKADFVEADAIEELREVLSEPRLAVIGAGAIFLADRQLAGLG